MSKRDDSRPRNAPMEPEWARFTGAARLLVMWNALLAFAVELALFAFVVWWVISLDLALWWRLLIAVGAVLVLAFAWGTLVSPKARFHLPVPAIIAIKGGFFGIGTAVLWDMGHPVAAIAFLSLAMFNAGLAATIRANVT